MFYKMLFLLILAILAAVFAMANPGPVAVNLVFWKIQNISLALVILVSVLLGVLMIGVFSIFEQIKSFFTIRRLQQKINELETKVADRENLLKKQKDSQTGDFMKDSYNY